MVCAYLTVSDIRPQLCTEIRCKLTSNKNSFVCNIHFFGIIVLKFYAEHHSIAWNLQNDYVITKSMMRERDVTRFKLRLLPDNCMEPLRSHCLLMHKPITEPTTLIEFFFAQSSIDRSTTLVNINSSTVLLWSNDPNSRDENQRPFN